MIKPLRWAFGGAILGVIGTVALVISQLTTIANAVQYFFPEIGPFDAAITIANPSVKGEPKLLSGGTVEMHVEFIESTTGRSKLEQCYVLIRLTPNHTKYDMELLKLPLLDSSTVICFSLAFPWKRGSPHVRSCCSWSSRHSGITPRRSIAGFGRRVGRCPMGWSLWTAG